MGGDHRVPMSLYVYCHVSKKHFQSYLLFLSLFSVQETQYCHSSVIYIWPIISPIEHYPQYVLTYKDACICVCVCELLSRY